MTPADRELDPALVFGPNPLPLYRLARTRYASLSGQGAALAPGRWNAAGEEAIYTSLEPSLAVLERLVHTPKDRMPSDLALMSIEIRGDWTRKHLSMEQDEATFLALPSLTEAQQFFSANRSGHGPKHPLAIAVPSVVVPAWNIVLYPQAAGFWKHVQLRSVELFDFDPRLFAGTPTIGSATE